MEYKKYIRSLLPSFEKARIMEDIRLMREELLENTLPPYENASKLFARRKFKAKEIAAFDKEFSRDVKTKTRGNFVEVTADTLSNAQKILGSLEVLVDDTYSEDVAKQGMTYLKANLLQYLEALSFAMRYSRKLLLWTYAAETNVAEGNSAEMGKELNKPEREWMNRHKEPFFQVMNFLNNKPKDIEKSLDDIPDMVIDEQNIDVVKRTVGLVKLDPFKFGLIPLALNPIYHVRMAVAEWQVSRMKASTEEKRALEYRLLHMKEVEKGGTPNAKLQENIEYTESRLEKLNYKLAKMEEAYG